MRRVVAVKVARAAIGLHSMGDGVRGEMGDDACSVCHALGA